MIVPVVELCEADDTLSVSGNLSPEYSAACRAIADSLRETGCVIVGCGRFESMPAKLGAHPPTIRAAGSTPGGRHPRQ